MKRPLITLLFLVCSFNYVFSQLTAGWGQVMTAGGSGNDHIDALACDNAGFIVFTGSFDSQSLIMGTNSFTLTANSYQGTILSTFFLGKSDTSGAVSWMQKIHSSNCDLESAVIETDDNNNIYAGGTIYSSPNGPIFQTVVFDSTHTYFLSAGTVAAFVAAYSPSGTVLWVQLSYAGGLTRHTALKWDPYTNTLLACGYYTGDSLVIDSAFFQNYSPAYPETYLIKYAVSGAVIWAREISGMNDDMVEDLCCDNSGNIYVAGRFNSPALLFSSGDTLMNGGNPVMALYDGFLAKFNSFGMFQWAKKGVCALDDRFISMAAAASQIVVAGNSSAPVSFGAYSAGPGHFLVTYDYQGTVSGTTAIPAGIVKVAVHDNGQRILVGGTFTGTVSMGPFTLTGHPPSDDVFLASVGNNGNIDFALSAGGYGSDELTGMAVAAAGKFLVCGTYRDTTIYFGQAFFPNSGNQDLYLAQVTLSNSPVFNMGGTVFSGLLPVDRAIAVLYDVEGNAADTAIIDTLGFFGFWQKPMGMYRIKAGLDPSSALFGQYFPSYFGDELFWASSDTIVLHSNLWGLDISLVPAQQGNPGICTIQGSVMTSQNQALRDADVFLFSQAGTPLGCTRTDPWGYFWFHELDFGNYVVHPEVGGKYTTPASVVLNAANTVSPLLTFIVSGDTIAVGTEELPPVAGSGPLIYPNPASENLYILLNSPCAGGILSVYNSLGLPVSEQTLPSGSPCVIFLHLTSWPDELYIVDFKSGSSRFSRKFVKKSE